MKKTYKFPQVEVVNIKIQNILAGSYQETPGKAAEQSSGSFGSRHGRFSDWDEDEE